MSSFAGVELTLMEEQFSDKGGLLEEIQARLLVADPATWTALLDQLTPRELVNIRTSRGLMGAPPTVIIDIGGGMGPGTLVLDDYPSMVSATALMTECDSEAPVGDPSAAPRVVRATWLVTPA